MRTAIAAFCAGRPVYAECGGFLYLLESLTGLDGNSHAMAGVFPARARMLPRLQRLGYVEVVALPGHPFLSEGEKIRGHEFHYSAISDMPAHIQRTCRVTRRKERQSLLKASGCTIRLRDICTCTSRQIPALRKILSTAADSPRLLDKPGALR